MILKSLDGNLLHFRALFLLMYAAYEQFNLYALFLTYFFVACNLRGIPVSNFDIEKSILFLSYMNVNSFLRGL